MAIKPKDIPTTKKLHPNTDINIISNPRLKSKLKNMKTAVDMSSKNIVTKDISKILQDSFMEYVLSTFVRGVPCVSDGLKPPQRRLLYVLNSHYGKGLIKSARIVGDCIGKYHPHGDVATYGVMTRFSQTFANNLPLTITQGNWGSVDKRSPAAMRYTEVQMAPLTKKIYFGDEYVYNGFKKTYDDRELEPESLSSKIPMVLINGSTGISTGYASDIPTHNPLEVCDATIAFLSGKLKKKDDILKYIQGPDSPVGGSVLKNKESIAKALTTGSGLVHYQLKHKIFEEGGAYVISVNSAWVSTEWERFVPKINDILAKPNLIVERKKIKHVIDLSTTHDNIDVRFVFKKNVSRKDVDDFKNKVIDAHCLLLDSIKYSMSIIDDVTYEGLILPKKCGVQEIISLWAKGRQKVLNKYFTDEILKLERRMKNLAMFIIFINNKDILTKSIDHDDNDTLIKKFSKYKIDKDGIEFILASTYSMSRKNAEQVRAKINQIKDEINRLDVSRNDVVKYMINEIKDLKAELKDHTRKMEVLDNTTPLFKPRFTKV